MSENKSIRECAKDYSIGLNERESRLAYTAYLDGAAKKKELDAQEIEKLKEQVSGLLDRAEEFEVLYNKIKDYEQALKYVLESHDCTDEDAIEFNKKRVAEALNKWGRW